jgi:hypothetical protein
MKRGWGGFRRITVWKTDTGREDVCVLCTRKFTCRVVFRGVTEFTSKIKGTLYVIVSSYGEGD